VLQWQAEGQLLDFTSVKLIAGGTEYAPTNFVTEFKASGSGFGGVLNRGAVQWDLSGLGIRSYLIKFNSESSSTSLQEIQLDTTPTYVEVVPSDRTWTAGSGAWSNPTHWSPGSIPPMAGNVIVVSGTSLTVDCGVREISDLRVSVPGSFTFGAGGGTLKINTGISATPASPASYVIDAPVTLGSFNLTFLNADTELVFNGPIGGSAGFYFSGAGRMKLNANNIFTGAVTVDHGTLEIAGTNAYAGPTTVFAGSLVVKANALAGSGALGVASGAVAIGSTGTFGEPEAALLTDGAITVARNLSLTAGDDPKKLGGRNTASGALFSGNVVLSAPASGVAFHAENAADLVTFSGALTGGMTTGTAVKTGAGKVVFAGAAAKSFLNPTTVQAGTLELAAGATFGGNGALSVASGAVLSGAGTISRATAVSGTQAPGAPLGTLTHTGALSYDSAAHLLWRLGSNATTAGTFGQVAAASVTVAAGARLDLNFNTPGGTVDFTDLFWQSARSWPGLTSTALSGTFTLGMISNDSAGHVAGNYGVFALNHATTGVTLTWTPFAPWESWRRVSFGADWNNAAISGETVDAEQDGQWNVTEYALAGNGAVPSALPQPAKLGNRLALTFLRNAAATDVTITIRGGDSPAGPWTELAQSVNGAPTAALLGGVAVAETGSGAVRQVEVRDLFSTTDPAHPRRFLQIHIQR
jgi:autotransporter-associated beta strand protein